MSPYVTVDDVKAVSRLSYKELGFATDAEYITLIEVLILAAQEIIERYCGVPADYFQAGGVTVTDEYHDGRGTPWLRLRYAPLVTVTTLSVNTAGLNQAPSWTSLSEGPGAGKHFIVYPDEGLLYIFDKTPGYGLRNVKVTYKTGYAATPLIIKEVTKSLSANALRGILTRKLLPRELTQLIVQGGDLRGIIDEHMELGLAHKRLLTSFKVVRADVA